MLLFFRLLRYTLFASLAAIFSAVLLGGGLYLYLSPGLPDTDTLRDVRLQVPLRVYTQDGALISEYGEVRRIPLTYDEFPEPLIAAILAAEDNRFFEHPGVDYQGLLRAAVNLIRTGDRSQGGSTITMQVARNFFLSRERTYTRKLNEILLALKIEAELDKEAILELYLNKIYLGHRSYGFAAAAQVYYGKPLSELTLDQFAMIAGLPKAPSAYNPVSNPQRAKLRRDYVLRRMLEVGYIDQASFEQAVATPDEARLHVANSAIDAHYIGEMVRTEMMRLYGDATYTDGLHVYTTINTRHQIAANRALRNNLLEYDRRHGYRGPLGHLTEDQLADHDSHLDVLRQHRTITDLRPALVLTLEDDQAIVLLSDASQAPLPFEGMKWAAPYIDVNRIGQAPNKPSDVLKVGDIVYVRANDAGELMLSQLPDVAGAVVSLSPQDGAVLALVGGFDFFHSKFNRATQAERQPGSIFKPFIYSAALEHGFTAASVVNDAPVVFDDSNLESEWRPSNYSGRFYGPTRFREALVNSRNLVSIRIMESVGIGNTVRFMENFGFDPRKLPRDLSLSLGSSSITPFDLARAYAVFANGGYLIEPYFIQRVEDNDGNLLFSANPALACDQCAEEEQEDLFSLPLPDQDGAQDSAVRYAPRTVDARNIYIMHSIMEDVIRSGTGRRALQLGRSDLGGKTGTTNEQRDAWFAGYNADVVSTAWVGFDTPEPLGNQETGAQAALPVWIDYMREALRGLPNHQMPQPEGIVSVRIDAQTGEYATSASVDALFELFRSENAPQPPALYMQQDGSEETGGGSLTDDIF
jgi:penicillin-binding protein 1A